LFVPTALGIKATMFDAKKALDWRQYNDLERFCDTVKQKNGLVYNDER
jgi:hypothetical protein